MLFKNYLIYLTLLFKLFIINSAFMPNLVYNKTINQMLSLPYYVQFRKKLDSLNQYSFWVSNNPYGSKLAESGYITKFEYDTENFDFQFKEKICSPNVLGLAACNCQNSVYPGIKSYVAITINNRTLLQVKADHEFSLYAYLFNNCKKAGLLNSNLVDIQGRPGNLKVSPYKYTVNGIKYQLVAIPYSYVDPSSNEFGSFIIFFQYALNYPNSLLYPAVFNNSLRPFAIINFVNYQSAINLTFAPNDIEFSPFACSDGSYLLTFTNRNLPIVSVYKLNLSNPASIAISPYESLDVGNYPQNFASFSNNRYLAVDIIDVAYDNLYAYYFDQNCNILPLNNNIPYRTGRLPQALMWSPDSKALIIPNYLDDSLTVYKANTCNIKVKLSPKVSVQYPDGSSLLTAKVFNGTPPYTFYFSNGQTVTQESNTYSITVSPNQTTIYNVTVIDSNNCITGKANPVTVQVAKPVITSIVPNCQENSITIKGIVLDPSDLPVINTTIELFIDSDKAKKVYVTSDCSGFFVYKYRIN